MCIRDSIRNVYKYFSLQRHGALIRGELEWDEYWRWESDDIMAAVYYNTEQKPLGYVIYYIRDEVLRIKEIVYLTPVSYTHLDVYKRQGMHRRLHRYRF